MKSLFRYKGISDKNRAINSHNVHWLVYPDVISQRVPAQIVRKNRVVLADVERSILQAGVRKKK